MKKIFIKISVAVTSLLIALALFWAIRVQQVTYQLKSAIGGNTVEVAKLQEQLDGMSPTNAGSKIVEADLNKNQAVAKIGGWYVKENDVRLHFLAYKKYTLKSRNATQLSDDEASKLLESAIGQDSTDYVIQSYAEKNGITVTSKEVDARVTEVFEQNGGEEPTVRVLEEYYGWTKEDFRARVRDALLKAKVNERLGGPTQGGQSGLVDQSVYAVADAYAKAEMDKIGFYQLGYNSYQKLAADLNKLPLP
jgi:hypothetical protein